MPHETSVPTPRRTPSEGAHPSGAAPNDPHGDFWTAREVLAHLHTFARARRAAPWAVLGVALARVVVATPPRVVLPALVGSDASLNIFVAIVGASGAGKGAAMGAGTDALDVGDLQSAPLGSGEGLTRVFVHRVNGVLEQHTDAVLASVGEVDTLTALTGRAGATLQPVLRNAYMGEEFGFGYADSNKRLVVGAHRYRLALLVGVQPLRAGGLMADADGGTPQRLLWLPATDPHAPDTPPDLPAPMHWSPPPLPSSDADVERIRLSVCSEARATVDEARLQRIRGLSDALQSHALLSRLKVAAALGLLDGRLEVSAEDWQLASAVMMLSDATGAKVVAELHDKERGRNDARAAAAADRAQQVTERREGVQTSRVARNILRHLAVKAEGMTEAQLRRATAARDRPLFCDAVAQLLEARQITVQILTPERGAVRRRYRTTQA